MPGVCDKLRQEVDELESKLHQTQLDRERVVQEKSDLTDKVSVICLPRCGVSGKGIISGRVY